MAQRESGRIAVPVKFEHSGRSVNAVEWSSPGSRQTIVIAIEGESSDVADLVGPVAEKLMDRSRVIGVALKSAWDPVTIAWSSAEPAVLLAQGDAGRLACETARLAPGALRALVLADYAPPQGVNDHSSIATPVLIFHGRASSAETHAQAVKVHGEIPGSHLIELDGCGEVPTKNCATELAESVNWFLDELGKPYLEFTEYEGSEKEPVDPKR